MFEPTRLPKATSVSLRIAAMTDVTSSGMQVPTATIVRPTTVSEMPKDRASVTAPSTRK